ncbi:94a36a80-d35d-42d5-9b5e-eaef1dc9a9b6 [Thermothielavioides terrestris]|uniref:94a36a80-d35d-42d5-9b5e-eaef1dc9a9b6 n=1 Tax=Thermothielavioides terrestris TaxID=2587410 RepID=A0A3S4C2W9_9PEZI|nr:94a36a80-d35d-42d5-9b5e-eaef1dc9a9b6 [Thermothielavioides terrestris]
MSATTIPQRPGTSGTEAALKTSRRLASEQLRQAERAERVYRARKRAAAARANYAEARSHLRQAREHLALGARLLFGVVRWLPYVWREKSEARRVRAEEKKRRKVIEMKRRLEEKLAASGGGLVMPMAMVRTGD